MCSALFTLRGPDAGMHVPQIVLRPPPTDKGPVAGDTFLGIPTKRVCYRCSRLRRRSFCSSPNPPQRSLLRRAIKSVDQSQHTSRSGKCTLARDARLQNTGGPSSQQERGCDSCLRAVLCYKRLFTKVCMGCKRFFLKERKNVMFLNKIDLPSFLVVFFVVGPRLRPF